MKILALGIMVFLTAPSFASGSANNVASCKQGLKKYVIDQVGTFTQENEKAINRNCSKQTKEYLCFINKTNALAREQGHTLISNVDRGVIEEECGIR